MSSAKGSAAERRLRAAFVRRAAEVGAPLLAPALAHYAAAEGLSWADLAAELGCPQDCLDRVACCRPPREGRFTEDADAIAEHCGVDPGCLLGLLRRLRVLDAFAHRATDASVAPDATSADTSGMLLAARDREEAGPLEEEGDAG
jgi:hypothetical protein